MSTTSGTTTTTNNNSSVYQKQQQHLDDTDVYSTVWQDAILQYQQQLQHHQLQQTSGKNITVKWGGRGKGGRGIARRTLQPNDVCIPDGVRLEYVGVHRRNHHRRGHPTPTSPSLSLTPRLLLENARLNFRSGRTYGMIGPNGCGKSSLLRRIDSCKIPGFPVHMTTLWIQPYLMDLVEKSTTATSKSTTTDTSTVQYLIDRYYSYCTDHVQAVNHSHIQHLEDAIERLDLNDGTDAIENETTLNEYMDEIAAYEELIADNQSIMNDENAEFLTNAAIVALEIMGLPKNMHDLPFHTLTSGQQSKVLLALILLCCTVSYCDLLLIDEITSTLDVHGLIQLRRIIRIITSPSGERVGDDDIPFVPMYYANPHRKPTTVVLVSHDNDFLNDVATDIVEFHSLEKKLYYYRGNYHQYLVQRQQKDTAQVHQVETLQKKEVMMQQVLSNMQSQPVHTSRGAKKKAKTINCHKKKMEKVLYNNNTAITPDTKVVQHILRRKKYEDEPDKQIQFNFRHCSNQWNEPIVVAMDVGHSFRLTTGRPSAATLLTTSNDQLVITCKDGYLFDSVDFSVSEGGVYCILGASGCGKSTFLKILSKQLVPTEGTIQYAHGSHIAYIDFSIPQIIQEVDHNDAEMTTLQYLMKNHPIKTEHEIRSELSSFGLGPKQAQTMICFLSGGEQCRFAMAQTMLRYPHLDVLCLDNPTANLDVESVDALIYGLNKWNGTIVMSCHDSYFVRSFSTAKCFVLTGSNEGKLRFVKGGIDEYIRSFGSPTVR